MQRIPGKIVLLCGTSTAGKTSICTELEKKARETKRDFVVDGSDLAQDAAWTKDYELGGITYHGASDFFVKKMELYTKDQALVESAVSKFGARTLSISLLSRSCLGNPIVDQVDLSPLKKGETIEQRAKVIHDSQLSEINKQKYSLEDIQKLLKITNKCPPTGQQFFDENPYPPLKDVNKLMLEEAIKKAKEGKTIILDIIGNETIDGQSMVGEFKKYLKSAELPESSGEIITAHCPINTLVTRIESRNQKAKAEGRSEDIRQSFFPFDQYGLLYEKVSDLDPSKETVGMVSRQDVINAAKTFGKGKQDADKLLDSLGFIDGEEEIFVAAKIPGSKVYQTGEMTSKDIAEDLFLRAFPPLLSHSPPEPLSMSIDRQSCHFSPKP